MDYKLTIIKTAVIIGTAVLLAGIIKIFHNFDKSTAPPGQPAPEQQDPSVKQPEPVPDNQPAELEAEKPADPARPAQEHLPETKEQTKADDAPTALCKGQGPVMNGSPISHDLYKFKRSRYISFDNNYSGNEPVYKKNDRISLSLFPDVSLSADVRKADKDINGVIGTTGRITDQPFGRVYLARSGNRIRGSILMPEKGTEYIIDYDPDQKSHIVMEVDLAATPFIEDDDQVYPPRAERKFAKEEQKNSNPETAGDIAGDDRTPPSKAEDAAQNVIIDYMVVYTTNALNAESGATIEEKRTNINNTISLGIQKMNDVHESSLTDIEFNLVFSTNATYVESGVKGTDLDNITYTNDGLIVAADTWRETYNADFVTLMISGNVGGIAWTLEYTNGWAAYAFSVVGQPNFSSYTTVHEVGHNMGLSHAADQNTQPGPTGGEIGTDAAGWHWHPTPGSNGFCSVLTYTSGTYFDDALAHSRVGYISDPNLLDPSSGMAMGHSVTANNARVIREMREVYQGYRDGGNYSPVVHQNTTFYMLPDTTNILTTATLSASDANASDGPTVLTYTITTIPTKGVLKNDGTVITNGASFSQQDLATSNITYTCNAGQSGEDQFIFNLKDDEPSGPEDQELEININTDPPLVLAFSPASGYTGTDIDTDLQITFHENVKKGSGGILVKKMSDLSTIETISATSSVVTITNNKVYIDRSTTLLDATEYYIEIATNAFLDLTDIPFSGFSGTSTWYFTCQDAPYYSESFESGMGVWTQGVNDVFDWTRDTSPGTATPETGPSSAQNGTVYMYTEASSPATNENDTADLESEFDFSSYAVPELAFYYHMWDGYDAGYMGTLQVDTSTNNGGAWSTIWTMSGNQDDLWHKATVDLSAYAGISSVLIRFRGLRGANYVSDIAIDSISLSGTTDTDQDGMGDSWETNWFATVTNSASDDYDRDGLSNGLEYSLKTDPTGRTAPGWWSVYGVLSTNSPVTNDYAICNQGQLKWIAVQAEQALDSFLSGGAGTNVDAVISGFTLTNNYQAVNIGQVKNVAKPFYDTLISNNLASGYPWTGAASTNDYGAVNIGQIKHIFSFELY